MSDHRVIYTRNSIRRARNISDLSYLGVAYHAWHGDFLTRHVFMIGFPIRERYGSVQSLDERIDADRAMSNLGGGAKTQWDII